MAKQLNATELDFDKIRGNLKSFLSNQSKFSDYNFDGSGLSILLDLLSYNTHYNALNTHFTINEAFLDSAQIRGNVVSHAKLLGYVPRSAIGSVTNIDLHIPAPIGEPIPSALTLERGATLAAIIDGVEYPFVVLDSVTVSKSLDDTFTFSNILIKQGVYKIIRDRVDTSLDNQRFNIPEENVDTTTLIVRVRENQDSQSYKIYTRFTSFIAPDQNSQIYFLQENNSGQYELYFGDGVTGIKLDSNNIVEIEYVYTAGAIGNGAGKNGATDPYTFTSEIGGNTGITITPSILGSLSSGGSDREDIDSIRFNAPLTFITQNRAVTADDYKSILVKEYGDIEAISTWGGENSDPPDYGKIYISIKPKSGSVLSAQAKLDISSILKGKNVVSITPVFVDPEYTYIKLDIYFKYNPNITDRTRAELEALVRQKVTEYNLTELRRFDGVFRYSQLTQQIDASDPGILNSIMRNKMIKLIPLIGGQENAATLYFSAKTYKSESDEHTLTSEPFQYNGENHYFGDIIITDEITDDRRIYVYKLSNNEEVVVLSDVGRLYTTTGKLELYGFVPDNTETVSISVLPESFDIAPKRNQLIEINLLDVKIIGEIDTIATAGSAGAIDYETTSRHG